MLFYKYHFCLQQVFANKVINYFNNKTISYIWKFSICQRWIIKTMTYISGKCETLIFCIAVIVQFKEILNGLIREESFILPLWNKLPFKTKLQYKNKIISFVISIKFCFNYIWACLIYCQIILVIKHGRLVRIICQRKHQCRNV